MADLRRVLWLFARVLRAPLAGLRGAMEFRSGVGMTYDGDAAARRGVGYDSGRELAHLRHQPALGPVVLITPTDGCDCWPLPAVVAPINTPTGVQCCDVCAPDWMGDLDAALLLALQLSGAEVRFWQDDLQRLAELGEDARLVQDWAEAGFTQRSYARPARADDCVLSGTDPWVEIDGRPVDWVHVLWVLDAGFGLAAWPLPA